MWELFKYCRLSGSTYHMCFENDFFVRSLQLLIHLQNYVVCLPRRVVIHVAALLSHHQRTYHLLKPKSIDKPCLISSKVNISATKSTYWYQSTSLHNTVIRYCIWYYSLRRPPVICCWQSQGRSNILLLSMKKAKLVFKEQPQSFECLYVCMNACTYACTHICKITGS